MCITHLNQFFRIFTCTFRERGEGGKGALAPFWDDSAKRGLQGCLFCCPVISGGGGVSATPEKLLTFDQHCPEAGFCHSFLWGRMLLAFAGLLLVTGAEITLMILWRFLLGVCKGQGISGNVIGVSTKGSRCECHYCRCHTSVKQFAVYFFYLIVYQCTIPDAFMDMSIAN